MCSISASVLSLDKIPDSCPIRTPDSYSIRTPCSYLIRTPDSYLIRTPDSYHIRTPCSNVIRTEYFKGGRTPDSLRIKVYRKEKVPQIFRFAGL